MAPGEQPDSGNDPSGDKCPQVDLRRFEDKAGDRDHDDHLKDGSWSHGPRSILRPRLVRDGRSGGGLGDTVLMGCRDAGSGRASRAHMAIRLTNAMEPKTIIRKEPKRLSAYSLVRASTRSWISRSIALRCCSALLSVHPLANMTRTAMRRNRFTRLSFPSRRAMPCTRCGIDRTCTSFPAEGESDPLPCL